MNVPLVTELVIPQKCGFSGAMTKKRALAMLRFYAEMIEEDASDEVKVWLEVTWEGMPDFRVVRYSHF